RCLDLSQEMQRRCLDLSHLPQADPVTSAFKNMNSETEIDSLSPTDHSSPQHQHNSVSDNNKP
ncbi:hypothetical protein KI387_013739, partial [Taxus chinensis]